MRDNPFHTFLQFATGQTGDQLSLHGLAWFTVALFWVIALSGLAVAAYSWRRDPGQRTGQHLAIFLMRFTMAGMWYQGTLWKLPWPIATGFDYWLKQTAKFSSFQFHADIMQLFIDHVAIAQPLVYLLEIFFTASLMLGFAVRFTGIVAALFTANLWIGLYNDPTEWGWTYMAIICAMGMFATVRAGFSLGLDNLIAQGLVPFPAKNSVIGRAYMLAS